MHKQQTPTCPQPFCLTVAAVCLTLLLPGCRSGDDNQATGTEQPISPAYTPDPIKDDQSSFLAHHVSSGIHWQNWHAGLFEHAKSEKKTILALVGSGTDFNTLQVLDHLNKSPAICSLLRGNHINALIDTNLHPDMGFLAGLICMRSNTAISSPILIWFSHEGNPISWSPVNRNMSNRASDIIRRMSHTVYSLWLEDPDYVLSHSRKAFGNYDEQALPQSNVQEEDMAGILVRTVRRAAALFDPTSNSVDNIGHLSRARYIDFLVQASQDPGLPLSQRQDYLEIACRIANHALLYGLIDPLDGGVFSGKQRTTNALPVFSKSLRVQALTMMSLYRLYQASGDTEYLNAANRIYSYTHEYLSQEDGSYILGITYLPGENQEHACLWSMDEISAVLSKNQMRTASLAFGLEQRGNIPLVDDPERIYHQKNSLSWKTTIENLAQETSSDKATLNRALEDIYDKLAAARTQKEHQPFIEYLTTVESMSLFASACIAGYRASGDNSQLDEAKKILQHIREHMFGENGQLHRARFKGIRNEAPAKAIDYARLCEAALDLHEVTLEPEWLEFAHHQHQLMNQNLAIGENFLVQEYDGTGHPRHYPVYRYYTLFSLDSHSTVAVVYANAKRLNLRLVDENLPPQIKSLASILYGAAILAPAGCTDLLTYEPMIQSRQVYFKPPADPALFTTACRQACQIIAVTTPSLHPLLTPVYEKLPAGSAAVVIDGSLKGTASSPPALINLLK